MSSRTDEPLRINSAPSWLHQTVLDGQPVAGLARAFVRHHLAEHRLFHLVDLVGLVAIRFTTDDSLGGRRRVVTMSLSQTDDVVFLRVDEAATFSGSDGATVVDESIGSGVFGLLTLQWGVSRTTSETTGLWASFDAHKHKPRVTGR